MSEECWLPVREFPDHYEISDLGRLRRTASYHGLYAGKIRKPRIDVQTRYVVYMLSVRNKQYMRSAHRMIADAFLGPIPKGMQVNHKDGDKANSVLTNLEVVTVGENCEHAYRVLKRSIIRCPGEKSPKAKLTWESVRAMREEYARGRIGYRPLGKRFGVSYQTVKRVVQEVCWQESDRPKPSLPA